MNKSAMLRQVSKVLTVLLLIVSSFGCMLEASAQTFDTTGFYVKPVFDARYTFFGNGVVVGDTEVVGNYVWESDCDSAFDIYEIRIKDSAMGPFYVYPIAFPIPVIFKPTHAGAFSGWSLDCVLLSTIINAYCSGSHMFYGREKRSFSAIGLSDSIVMIRPKAWTIDMSPDPIRRCWVGTSQPEFSNNVSVGTTFSTFQIISDTSLQLTLSVKRGNSVISSYSANAFTRRQPLQLEVLSHRGEALSGKTYQGSFTVHVKNRDVDSTFVQLVSLRFKTIQHNYRSSVTPSTITFSTQAGDTGSTQVIVEADSVYSLVAPPLSPYPFSIQTLQSKDTMYSFTVLCMPVSSGRYGMHQYFHLHRIDFAGEDFLDSVGILLNVSIDNSKDAMFWSVTSSETGASVAKLVVGNDGVVYAGDGNLFMSVDSGSSWRSISDGNNVQHIALDQKNTLYVQTFQVRSTWDRGATWHDSPPHSVNQRAI